jgi:membrane fusion protein (multidrug efflux system)
MKRSARPWIFTILGLLLVVLALAGVKAGQIGAMIAAGKTFKPPPESVTSALVRAETWQPSRPAIATLVAVHGTTLGAELSGTVREVAFDSGAAVKKGQLLVRLDTSNEEAQLQAATAEASLAKLNLERARSLSAAGATSQADLDGAEARMKQAAAAVAALQATIGKKVIRAPFDGRIAIRQIELGQVASPGTPIASIQSVDPIFADAWVPQQALADLKQGQAARLRTDTFPEASWEGTVSTVNPEVDPATRNVLVRATFPNPDGRLRPGMFANLELLAEARRPVLLIPATAVIYAPYGDSVYTIEKKAGEDGKEALTARQKFVRLGERRGDLVAVASGLAAGETVVSSGGFKLRNGAAVVVHDELAPQAEEAPKPVDR